MTALTVGALPEPSRPPGVTTVHFTFPHRSGRLIRRRRSCARERDPTQTGIDAQRSLREEVTCVLLTLRPSSERRCEVLRQLRQAFKPAALGCGLTAGTRRAAPAGDSETAARVQTRTDTIPSCGSDCGTFANISCA